MVQCITCMYCVMHGQPKGKGTCWKDADGTGKRLDVLAKRNCRVWKLGCMAQVHGRSTRLMAFDDSGIVTLKGGNHGKG